MTLRLIRGKRQASQQLSLSGGEDDLGLLESVLPVLRQALDQVEEDPFLLLNDAPNHSERIGEASLPPAETMAADILAAAEGLDLVGILASGEMSFGFANHLGQFNWQQGESWNFDWSLYSHGDKAVKRSPLLKLAEGERKLSPLVSLSEEGGAGFGPLFQSDGFIRPERVELIAAGEHRHSLISPRSAREFGLTPNADGREFAESMHLAAGSLPSADALAALGTGVYLSNLWYLNFSDRSACRVTGMTRFACFWVEDGKIVAPLGVMRFDDSLFDLLGEQLEALTAERSLLVDPHSYGGRFSFSKLMPGALVKSLRFSL
ncbi:metallopeptidase TldD-related protein [Chromobacterium sp. IIBBL 290-4]|uniref:metallopeptidase TldD-related protein n=1 Tax=Chromobacterium sp. IIBBL 290-4 TaxID=2953890 RepID=UPI0020B8BD21|nr:metallopeptidase TldD-related protein [Chromobacterium sp. IIBBL 290-4]UTH73558.1 metallopeptidase TldD-related protein [Chromobacterium sp. IIBBL 290-4]